MLSFPSFFPFLFCFYLFSPRSESCVFLKVNGPLRQNYLKCTHYLTKTNRKNRKNRITMTSFTLTALITRIQITFNGRRPEVERSATSVSGGIPDDGADFDFASQDNGHDEDDDNDDDNDNNGDELIEGVENTVRGTKKSLGQQWASKVPELGKAYKISCAMKTPDPTMLVGKTALVCCNGPAVATKRITCYYITGMVTRDVSFCRTCHANLAATLLEKFHMFPATPTSPQTAFHVELLGLFSDTQDILFASLDGFSKVWARRFYGGKVVVVVLILILYLLTNKFIFYRNCLLPLVWPISGMR
ncbi:unnamed protein product [Absidia cylindrospora]